MTARRSVARGARSLGPALRIAGNDLRRRARDRSIVIQVVLAPVLLALIVGGAFSGRGGGIDATIAIADADGTSISRGIVQGLVGGAGTDETGLRLTARSVDGLDEVRDLVDGDTVDAAVMLPDGLAASLSRGEAVELTVVGDAGDGIGRGIAESIAADIAARLSTGREVAAVSAAAGTELRTKVDPARVRAAVQGVRPTVRLSGEGIDNTFSMMAFFAPSMAMIFLFFVMGAAARSIISERRDGTLQRLLAGPVTPQQILLGKTAGVAALGVASLLVVWAVTSIGFRVDWGSPIGVLAVILAAVVAIAGISLVLVGVARTEEQAESFTIIASLLFAVLGGSFVYAGTGALAVVRQFTPNGQALIAFIDLSAGRAGLVDVLPQIGILLAMGVVAGGAGLVTLRRGLGG